MCSTETDILESNHRCEDYRRSKASVIRRHYFLSEKVVRRLMKRERLAVPLVDEARKASSSYWRACV